MDRCFRCQRVLCGRKTVFVVSFQALDVGKHGFFGNLMATDDNEAVFEDFHTDLLASEKTNVFLASNAVFNTADS